MIETLILKKARELISDPDRWTKGEMARTMFGASVSANDSKATCWCVMGAIHHETKDDPFLAGSVYQMVRAQLQGRSVSEFNDDPNTTHEAVMTLLDKAIASTPCI